MSYLKERVSFLKGLAEGMQISDSTNEGKLLKAMIDVLDDMAMTIEDIEEIQDEISEQVDGIDEDLAEVEKAVFDEDDEDEDDDIDFKEIDCPHCGESIEIDTDMIDEDGETITCPSCGKEIEVVWECGCGCDCEDEEEESKE
jgi:predicted Zn finger-like uncharacterized protein